MTVRSRCKGIDTRDAPIIVESERRCCFELSAWRSVFATVGAAGILCGCGPAERPEELQSRLNVAVSAFERGDSTAVEQARAIAELAPASAAGSTLLGLATAALGEVAAALPHHQEAVRRAPGDPKARFLLAQAALAAGQWDQALAAYARVLEMRPNDLHVHHLLAENLRYRGDPAAAVAHLRAIVAADPANLSALLDLGETLVELGRVDQGRAIYAAAAAVNPDLSAEARSWMERGAALDAGPELLRCYRFAANLQRRGETFRGSRARLERSDLIGPMERVEPPATPAPDQPGPWLGEPVVLLAAPDGAPDGIAADAVLLSMGDADLLVLATGGALWGLDPDDADHPRPLGGPSGAVALAGGDFTLDGLPDLAVADREGRLWIRAGTDRPLELAAAEAPVATALAPLRALIALDYDLDGDLDLVADRHPRPIALLRNNGEGSFSELAEQSGLRDRPSPESILVQDVDFDGDADLLLIAPQAPGIARYVGEGRFRVEPGPPAGAVAAALVDLCADPRRDLALLDGGGVLRVVDPAGSAPLAEIDLGIGAGEEPGPGGAEGSWRMLPWDADRDGFADLLVASPSGRTLVVSRSDSTSLRVRPARPLGGGDVLALWFRAGRPWIVTLDRRGGARAFPGLGAGIAQAVRLQGIKDNTSAIGSRTELRAGRLFASDRVDPAPGSGARRAPRLHFELGSRAAVDRIKVHWPNGVWQDRQRPPRRTEIEQDPALLGSCPFLYAWTGERFDFVTDILGNAPLGLALAPGVYFPFNPREHVALDRLEPREGFLDLRLTEELRETIYIDRVELVAVDLPGGARALSANALRPPPFPAEPLALIGPTFPVAAAIDERGRDQSERLRARDDRFTGTDLAHHAAYQGLADRTHWLELDLGPIAATGRVALVLHGGYWWSEAGNYAASQARGVAVPPRLEVPDGRGGWRTAKAPFGFPGGRPKTVVHEIGDLLDRADPRLRIVTNFRLHWDQIAVDTTAVPPRPRTTRLDPHRATLRYRGYSAALHEGAPVPYAFDYADSTWRRPYPRMTGAYTRFGDVRPLLLAADDRLVVMGHGEEIALRFDASDLPPLEPGFHRSFLFYSVGWDKDGDPKTAHRGSVAPLPFLAMSSYPFAEGEAWPASDSLLSYVRAWNTRIVSDPWGL